MRTWTDVPFLIVPNIFVIIFCAPLTFMFLTKVPCKLSSFSRDTHLSIGLSFACQTLTSLLIVIRIIWLNEEMSSSSIPDNIINSLLIWNSNIENFSMGAKMVTACNAESKLTNKSTLLFCCFQLMLVAMVTITGVIFFVGKINQMESEMFIFRFSIALASVAGFTFLLSVTFCIVTVFVRWKLPRLKRRSNEDIGWKVHQKKIIASAVYFVSNSCFKSLAMVSMAFFYYNQFYIQTILPIIFTVITTVVCCFFKNVKKTFVHFFGLQKYEFVKKHFLKTHSTIKVEVITPREQEGAHRRKPNNFCHRLRRRRSNPAIQYMQPDGIPEVRA